MIALPKQFLSKELLPVVQLVGQGTKNFLQGQTTSNILSLKTPSFFHTCLLDASGRMISLLEIKLEEESCKILVLSGDHHKVINHFQKIIFPADQVAIESVDKVISYELIHNTEKKHSLNSFWISLDSNIPDNLLDIPVATKNQIEYWRLIQGRPPSLEEINSATNPYELGLTDLISIDKGCYLGQEILSKISLKGNLKQELRFFVAESRVSPGQLLKKELENKIDRKIAGVITSSLEDVENKVSYGLAMVRSSALNLKNLFIEDSLDSVSIKRTKGFKSLKTIR